MTRATLLCALLLSAAPSLAQETPPLSPDGSRAFSIEPYVGVLGGYHAFDRDARSQDLVGAKAESWLVSGVAGLNFPLGPVFVGAEGNVAKGFNDIDWEYGVTGRFGFRAGESGMIYASAGYQWVQGRASRGFADTHGVIYGLGVEVGPQSIGLGGILGEAGPRLRLEVQSYDLDSIRPMAGLIFHF